MKKKISFDVPMQDFEAIQKYCKFKNMKISEFYRDAGLQRFEKETNEMIIFVLHNNKIEKFKIEKKYYHIKLYDAEQGMVEMVGAIQQGELTINEEMAPKFKDENLGELEIVPPVTMFMNVENLDKVNFYTKEYYFNSELN